MRMRRRSEEGENHQEFKKGLWTLEEDNILTDYVQTHGKGQWNRLVRKTGLKRCGKSCRLRWINYLSPNVKKGNFTEQEEDLIIRLHKLLGNRWSLIAKRLPGRTDNQVKNHWNTHLSKRFLRDHSSLVKTTTTASSPQHHQQDNVCDKSFDCVVSAPIDDNKPKVGLAQSDVVLATCTNDESLCFEEKNNNCFSSNAFWLHEDEFELSSLVMMDFASCDLGGYCL